MGLVHLNRDMRPRTSCDVPAVLSVQEAADDHPHLDAIIAALGRVQNKGKCHQTPGCISFSSRPGFLFAGSSTVIQNFRLGDLVPSARELHGYYRYVGSMTTPGCEQAVAWTVFQRTLSISSRQVRAHVRGDRSVNHHGVSALRSPVSPARCPSWMTSSSSADSGQDSP